MGERIAREDLQGAERAEYGKQVVSGILDSARPESGVDIVKNDYNR